MMQTRGTERGDRFRDSQTEISKQGSECVVSKIAREDNVFTLFCPIYGRKEKPPGPINGGTSCTKKRRVFSNCAGSNRAEGSAHDSLKLPTGIWVQ